MYREGERDEIRSDYFADLSTIAEITVTGLGQVCDWLCLLVVAHIYLASVTASQTNIKQAYRNLFPESGTDFFRTMCGFI